VQRRLLGRTASVLSAYPAATSRSLRLLSAQMQLRLSQQGLHVRCYAQVDGEGLDSAAQESLGLGTTKVLSGLTCYRGA
jgi:hypothetical protein